MPPGLPRFLLDYTVAQRSIPAPVAACKGRQAHRETEVVLATELAGGLLVLAAVADTGAKPMGRAESAAARIHHHRKMQAFRPGSDVRVAQHSRAPGTVVNLAELFS
jgi:hypothetical protein